MQANKAVTKNGSVMGGSIMIGITHCTDQSVLDNGQTSVLETSINPGVANLSSTLGGTPRSIRPLTQVKLSPLSRFWRNSFSIYNQLKVTSYHNDISGL